MLILFLYILLVIFTVSPLSTTQNTMNLKEICKNLKCPAQEDPTCVKVTYKKAFKNVSFNVIVYNKCEIGYIKCHPDLKAYILPMDQCLLHNETNILKQSKRKTSKVSAVRAFHKIGQEKKIYLYGDNLSDSTAENGQLDSTVKLKHKRLNKKLTQKKNTIGIEKEHSEENKNYDESNDDDNSNNDDDRPQMNSNEALVEFKDTSSENHVKAKKKQDDVSSSVHVISNEKPLLNEESDDKSIDDTIVNNDGDENNDKSIHDTIVSNGEGNDVKSIDDTFVNNDGDEENDEKSIDDTIFNNDGDENNDKSIHDTIVSNDEGNDVKSIDDTFVNNDGDEENDEKSIDDTIVNDGETSANNVHTAENRETDGSEKQNEDIKIDANSGEKKAVFNNDIKFGDDYDQTEEKNADLEEDNKDCPSMCASRDTMVCARCYHGIYRTFMSVCHLRAFVCTHPKDKLSLVSRHPCIQSAPFLSNLPPSNGRVHEPSDRVLQFIQCRAEGRLDKNDPKCTFNR